MPKKTRKRLTQRKYTTRCGTSTHNTPQRANDSDADSVMSHNDNRTTSPIAPDDGSVLQQQPLQQQMVAEKSYAPDGSTFAIRSRPASPLPTTTAKVQSPIQCATTRNKRPSSIHSINGSDNNEPPRKVVISKLPHNASPPPQRTKPFVRRSSLDDSSDDNQPTKIRVVVEASIVHHPQQISQAVATPPPQPVLPESIQPVPRILRRQSLDDSSSEDEQIVNRQPIVATAVMIQHKSPVIQIVPTEIVVPTPPGQLPAPRRNIPAVQDDWDDMRIVSPVQPAQLPPVIQTPPVQQQIPIPVLTT